MKSAPFDYVLAGSVAEATERLAAGAGGAVVIAGGQSLMPMLALRVAMAESLVDVGRIAALKSVTAVGDAMRIGAGVTHADFEDGRVDDPSGGLMGHVARGIAYRAVRNHGTIGGSLALADPAADWPACLLALGATVRITGPSGERTQPIDEFLIGAYTTSLETGEIITAIDVPMLPAGARWSYQKVMRKSGAFAMSIACVVRAPGRDATVVLGGTSTRAVLMPNTAKLADFAQLPGEAAMRETIAADLANAAEDADDYQKRLHTATVLRALRETAQ